MFCFSLAKTTVVVRNYCNLNNQTTQSTVFLWFKLFTECTCTWQMQSIFQLLKRDRDIFTEVRPHILCSWDILHNWSKFTSTSHLFNLINGRGFKHFMSNKQRPLPLRYCTFDFADQSYASKSTLILFWMDSHTSDSPTSQLAWNQQVPTESTEPLEYLNTQHYFIQFISYPHIAHS